MRRDALENVDPDDDAHNLAILGGEMTQKEAELLEQHVANNPTDVASRTKLLGYYLMKGHRDFASEANRARHVIWLVEHNPEAEVLGLPYAGFSRSLEPGPYDQVKELWQEAIRQAPESLPVLSNASRFFLQCDRVIAEELLLKAQKLDSRNPHWASSLGLLYALGICRFQTRHHCRKLQRKHFVNTS